MSTPTSPSHASRRGAHARPRQTKRARWLVGLAVVALVGILVSIQATSSNGVARRRVQATSSKGSAQAGVQVTSSNVVAQSSYQPPSQAHPVLAAFYFGQASPLNFWNSDLSGAPATFTQMKQEGFNAVELAVPWGEFQPGIDPPTYNTTAFKRLDSLISLAESMKLQVILRLSYSVDVDPADQDTNRFLTVFGNQTVYKAWLAYISKVRQNTARFPNIKIGELSWEDFWAPIEYAQANTSPSEALQLATESGFRPWLEQHYSLAQLSSLFGTTFTSWSQVPVPLNTQPAFQLLYQFDDWAIVNRFFVPASKRFPGLNLEARVEYDAFYNGSTQVGLYSHSDTFRLPGTNYIGMYFEPYMSDPSTDPVETVSQATSALQATLSSMQSRSGGLPLFVFEFEVVSNSLQIAGAPGLPTSSVPQFIVASAPLLHQYTIGYSLWTYRDYNQSPIYNPSFSLGTAGWKVSGSVRSSSSSAGSRLSMRAGSSVTQYFDDEILGGTSQEPLTVSFAASAPAGSSSTITVGLAGAAPQTVTVNGGTQTYQVQVPTSDLPVGSASGQLTLAASAPVTITNVQVYNFTQLGDIYSTTGAPESGASALPTLNQQLASGNPSS